MSKSRIGRIGEKNRIIDNIIEAMATRHHFLLLGHTNPDDNYIAGMISCSLILHMFYKDAMIFLGGQIHERFQYLLEICRYNAIRVLSAESRLPTDVDTVIVVDVPKPSMLEPVVLGLRGLPTGTCSKSKLTTTSGRTASTSETKATGW